MKDILNLEINRAIKGKVFLVSLSILCLYMIYDIVFSVIPTSNQSFFQINPALVTPHNLWIGMDTTKAFSRTYFFLMPVIATLPYATSLASDRKSKFIYSVISRSSKLNYFTSKFIASFLAGGLLYVVPLLLHFLILSLIFPGYPYYFGDFLVPNGSFYELIYSHPTLYILVMCFINFFYAGLFSTLGLAASFFTNRILISFMTPFLVWISIAVLAEGMGMPYLSPERFLRPEGVTGFSLFYVLFFFSIIMVVSFIICKVEGKKDETT